MSLLNNCVFAFLVDSSESMNSLVSSTRLLDNNSNSNNDTINNSNSSYNNINPSTVASASYPAFTNIEVAKAAVEAFYQTISKQTIANPGTSHPSLYLSNSSDNRSCELSSLGEHLGSFEDKIKHITASSGEHELFSYALTHLLSLLNKYRIQNGADTYGHGISTSTTQPVNIFILTNVEGLHRNRNINLSKRSHFGSLSELRAGCNDIFWDQHIHLIIVDGEPSMGQDNGNVGDNYGSSNKFLPPRLEAYEENNALVQICQNSGGEAFVVKDIRHASTVCSQLCSKLLSNHPSGTVKLSLSGQPSLLTHLFISKSSSYEWPIPENYWMNTSGSFDFLPRQPYPKLHLSRIQPNTENDMVEKWLNTCRQFNIPVDTFEIMSNPFKPTRFDKSRTNSSNIHNNVIKSYFRFYGASKSDSYFVSVEGSWNPTNSTGSPVPCGICRYNPTQLDGSGGAYQLLMLPFNFPKFLSLVKYIHDNSNAGYSQIQSEFKSYVASLPHYYYSPLAKAIEKNSSLVNFFPVRYLADIEMPKIIMGKIRKARETAIQDLQQISEILRVKRMYEQDSFGVKDIVGATLKYEKDLLRASNLPTSIEELKSESLLLRWDSIRRLVHGGNSAVVAGLRLNGAESLGRHVVGKCNHQSDSNIHRYAKRSRSEGSIPEGGEDDVAVWGRCTELGLGLDWSAVGAPSFARNSIKDMGDFLNVLSSRQVVRDPLLIDPPADEDEPAGLIKRKLEVDLNPAGHYFGKLNKKGSSLSVDESDLDVSTRSDTERVINSSIKSEASPKSKEAQRPSSIYTSTVEGEIDAYVSSFYADTPNPYISIEYGIKHNSGYISSDSDSEISNTSSHSSKPVVVQVNPADRNISDNINNNTTNNTLNKIQENKIQSPAIRNSTGTPSSMSTITAASEAELPAGWSQEFSRGQNRTYWYNRNTGKSVWIRPT